MADLVLTYDTVFNGKLNLSDDHKRAKASDNAENYYRHKLPHNVHLTTKVEVLEETKGWEGWERYRATVNVSH